MKKLAILGAILFGFNSFAQDFVVENIDHNKILYRGFENKIILSQSCGTDAVFQIEAINCEVSKTEVNGGKNTYIVKTKSKAQNARINFVSNGLTIDSAIFIVQNLPSPSLFWGNQQTGSVISNSTELEVKYASGITLKSSFEIVSWKCSQKEMNYEGQGNLLSQKMLDLTNSMAKGEVILIEVKVKGADGIIRKLEGSWVKQ